MSMKLQSNPRDCQRINKHFQGKRCMKKFEVNTIHPRLECQICFKVHETATSIEKLKDERKQYT